MDSITQLALGATVGYAVGQKQLGKKALYLGAFFGTLPDLDSLVLNLFINLNRIPKIKLRTL